MTGTVEVPKGIVSIEDFAFKDCSSLTSIKIPSGVTSIGNFAFDGCSSLTSISIPTSVTSIGYDAFGGYSWLRTIYGTSGSYAETYANEYGYTFVAE